MLSVRLNVCECEMGGLQREGALRSREACCHPAGRGQFGAVSAAGQGFLPTEATAEDTAFLQHEVYSSPMNFQVELRRHFSSLRGHVCELWFQPGKMGAPETPRRHPQSFKAGAPTCASPPVSAGLTLASPPSGHLWSEQEAV